MTRPEMVRRLATIPDHTLKWAHSAVLAGWGASRLSNDFMDRTTGARLTQKQANAIFEWVERYGRICPGG